ncbi:hypothetical protein WOSG25_390010, partial [Weissella oryzae SG25]
MEVGTNKRVRYSATPVNKLSDTESIFIFELIKNGKQLNTSDDTAVVSIKNASGFLID